MYYVNGKCSLKGKRVDENDECEEYLDVFLASTIAQEEVMF